jgi:hypothetical protein
MGAMLLTSSFATYNIISTITHEKRHDIAIMKSLGMREYSVRRIFIIESAMMGSCGNPVRLDSRISALLRVVADHDIQSAYRRDSTASDLLFADALYCRRSHFNSVLRGRRLLPGTQGDAGASGSKLSGRVLSEIALQVVGLVRRVQGVISHTLVDGIDLSVAKG